MWQRIYKSLGWNCFAFVTVVHGTARTFLEQKHFYLYSVSWYNLHLWQSWIWIQSSVSVIMFSASSYLTQRIHSHITWNLEVGWLKICDSVMLTRPGPARVLSLSASLCWLLSPMLPKWLHIEAHIFIHRNRKRGRERDILLPGSLFKIQESFPGTDFLPLRLGDKPYYWALAELRRDHLSKMWALPARKKGRA